MSAADPEQHISPPTTDNQLTNPTSDSESDPIISDPFARPIHELETRHMDDLIEVKAQVYMMDMHMRDLQRDMEKIRKETPKTGNQIFESTEAGPTTLGLEHESSDTSGNLSDLQQLLDGFYQQSLADKEDMDNRLERIENKLGHLVEVRRKKDSEAKK